MSAICHQASGGIPAANLAQPRKTHEALVDHTRRP